MPTVEQIQQGLASARDAGDYEAASELKLMLAEAQDPNFKQTQIQEPDDGLGDISELESFARGAGQDLTMGFQDEIAGTMDAAYGVMTGKTGFSMKEVMDTYTQGRDAARSMNKMAEAANPKSYQAGEYAGMAVPIAAGLFTGGASTAAALAKQGAAKTIGKGMLKGAGTGALTGATYAGGVSEAEDMGELASDVSAGLASGAALGGAMGGVGGVFTMGKNYLKGKRVEEGLKTLDMPKKARNPLMEEAVEKGGHGDLTDEFLDFADDIGATKDIKGATAKASKVKDEVGGALGNIRKKAAESDNYEGALDKKGLIKRIMPEGVTNNERRKIERWLDDAASIEGIGKTTTVPTPKGKKGAPKKITKYDSGDIAKIIRAIDKKGSKYKNANLTAAESEKKELLTRVSASLREYESEKIGAKEAQGLLSEGTTNLFKKNSAQYSKVAKFTEMIKEGEKKALDVGARSFSGISLSELASAPLAVGLQGLRAVRKNLTYPLARSLNKEAGALRKGGSLVSGVLRQQVLRGTQDVSTKNRKRRKKKRED